MVNILLTIWSAALRPAVRMAHHSPYQSVRATFFDRSSLGDGACSSGAQWSNVMSSRELRAEDNLLSAFALMIGGALGVATPLALLIIWLCS